MYHTEGSLPRSRDRIAVRRRDNHIEIRPFDFQAGDVICDMFGSPLRDKHNRKKAEK